MRVTVELYGIPRSRAGVARTTARGPRLADVIEDLTSRYPDLAQTCFDGLSLRPGFVANIDGERFVTDPETPLDANDCLLILSADAGG